MKKIIKRFTEILHLPVTKNQKYDFWTLQIMKKVLHKESNCIDVGCHKGEMLQSIIQLSPMGKHFAFEPLPDLFTDLKLKFESKSTTILPYAISNTIGSTSFQHVTNAPAYSGVRKRHYDIKNPIIKEITVELATLDSIIPEDLNIHFIKIDVEGGELNVLKGAEKLIRRCKPFIVFEFGLGASDYYKAQPEDLYSLLEKCGLNISLLSGFLKKAPTLSKTEFCKIYQNNSDYYFIGHR